MIKKLRIQNIVVFLLCIFILSGCGFSQDNEDALSDVEVQETEVEESTPETDKEDDIISEERKTDEEDDINSEVLETDKENNFVVSDDEGTSEVSVQDDTIVDELESEELLDAFLAGEIQAYYDDESDRVIMFDELPHDEWDYLSYFYVGERIDLDNDGEVEQIVNGPYGGIYFDARDGKVYVLAAGDGTASVLSYTDYDNAIWIVHMDTMHGGRQLYWLERHDGGGNIVDEFALEAEYWDSDDFKYHEDSDFTYRDEKITMAEYEALRKEILGW